MSNSLNQEKQSEYERDVLIDFLMSKGFIGEMKMSSAHIELSNNKAFVRIPNIELLSKTVIEDVLQNAGLYFPEFEEHLQSIENFKSMIDLGIVSKPKRD